MTRCLGAHRMQGQEHRLLQVQIHAVPNKPDGLRSTTASLSFHFSSATGERGLAFRGLGVAE